MLINGIEQRAISGLTLVQGQWCVCKTCHSSCYTIILFYFMILFFLSKYTGFSGHAFPVRLAVCNIWHGTTLIHHCLITTFHQSVVFQSCSPWKGLLIVGYWLQLVVQIAIIQSKSHNAAFFHLKASEKVITVFMHHGVRGPSSQTSSYG